MRIADHAHAVVEFLVVKAALPHIRLSLVHDREAAVGAAVGAREIPYALEQGERREVDHGTNAARLDHLVQMARQAEAGDVGAGVDVRGEHRLAGRLVELHHRLDRAARIRFGHRADLQGGAHDARAKRFGQVQHVSRARAFVAHELIGIDGSEHRQAVFGLIVVDGVTARDERPRLGDRIGASAQDLAGDARAERAVKREQVQRHMGHRAHREHVRKSVGRCDASEFIGIVHDGREEVHREHGGQPVAQQPDSGVVARLESQQEPFGVGLGSELRFGYGAQHRFEVSRTPLGRSTALGRQRRELDLVRLAIGHPAPPFRSA